METNMKKPFAADGTTIDESCRYKDGHFRLGETGHQEKEASLSVAIAKLAKHAVAKWRRPSTTTGRMGTVTAVSWS